MIGLLGNAIRPAIRGAFLASEEINARMGRDTVHLFSAPPEYEGFPKAIKDQPVKALEAIIASCERELGIKKEPHR